MPVFNSQSSQQNAPQPIRLGIWGTVGSGKTIFLAKLYRILSCHEDWKVSADEAAKEFVENSLKQMDNNNNPGLLPFSREITDEINVFSYQLEHQQSRIILDFIDAPGEFYENDPQAQVTIDSNGSANEQDNSNIYNNIIDYLTACDGIVFLLDPKQREEKQESYQILLLRLCNHLKARTQKRRLEQYLAFCVTKVDDDDKLWYKRSSPPDLVKEVVGQNCWDYLLNDFTYVNLEQDQPNKTNRCNFYATSAIGRYKDNNGEWRKAGYTQQEEQEPYRDFVFPDAFLPGFHPEPQRPTIQQRVDCVPINVIEPIEWLIEGIQAHPPDLPHRQKNISKTLHNIVFGSSALDGWKRLAVLGLTTSLFMGVLFAAISQSASNKDIKIVDLETELKTAEENKKQIEQRLTQIETKLDKTIEYEKQIEQIGQRLTQTEKKLNETINEKNEQLKEQLTQTEKKLDETINEKNEQLKERLTQTEKKLDETINEKNEQLKERPNNQVPRVVGGDIFE